MIDRLRSSMQTLGVTAFLLCALSLAGLGASHASPSNSSQSVRIDGEPCNDVCKAYMAWSDRVAAMFRPAQPLEKNAARHTRPLRAMVQHTARTRRPGLNSFAQLPVQSAAMADSTETPQATETPPAEVAPSRPMDRIADRFSAADKFMIAKPDGTDSATNDAAESRVVAVADTAPATRGTGTVNGAAVGPHLRLAAPLFLALCLLPALVLWRRFRGRRDEERAILC
jgi:hypothetical protein